MASERGINAKKPETGCEIARKSWEERLGRRVGGGTGGITERGGLAVALKREPCAPQQQGGGS